LGVVRSMLLKTTVVPGELLSVELGDWLLRADRTRVGHEAWHADPFKEAKYNQFTAARKRVSRFCNDQVRRLATQPPRQPTSIPPPNSRATAPADRKWT